MSHLLRRVIAIRVTIRFRLVRIIRVTYTCKLTRILRGDVELLVRVL